MCGIFERLFEVLSDQIATRYDKTNTSYAANLNLVAAIIAAR